MIKLSITNATTLNKIEHELDGSILSTSGALIGRLPECNIYLENYSVSRKHAQILLSENNLTIIDLGSLGGSYINNEKLEPNSPYTLSNDDTLEIGPYKIKVTYSIKEVTNTTSDEDPNTDTIVPELNAKILQPIAYIKTENWSYWKEELTEVTCTSIIRENRTTKSLIFQALPNTLFHFKPGQAANLHLIINNEQIIEPCFLSSSPSRPHSISFTITHSQKQTHSVPTVANWIFEHMQTGDVINVSKPFGNLSCHQYPSSKICLLSEGVGIAPMLSMIRWFSDTQSKINVHLIHFVEDMDDAIFKEELETLCAHQDYFQMTYILTQPHKQTPWSGLRSAISSNLLQLIVPDHNQRTIFVSGSECFMETSRQILSELEFPMRHYHEERYESSPYPIDKHNDHKKTKTEEIIAEEIAAEIKEDIVETDNTEEEIHEPMEQSADPESSNCPESDSESPALEVEEKPDSESAKLEGDSTD